MADALTGFVAGSALNQSRVSGGVVVRINSHAFLTILSKVNAPLVVVAEAGLLRKRFDYLTSYKGIAFCTSSNAPLELPAGAEVIAADSLPIPE